MKIAQVCPLFLPVIGGVGNHVLEISKNFIKQGHEVHVFTSNIGSRKKYELIDGIHVHRLTHWFKLGKFASFFPSVFFKILNSDFDVVHSHNFGQPHCLLSALACRLSGKKHFLTTHAPFLSLSERNFLSRFFVKLNYHTFGRLSLKLSRVIAISDWELSYLKKLGAKNINVIPNGVDESYLREEKSTEFKKKFGIKGRFVLFLGRVEKRKGADVLLKASKIVCDELADVCFVIAGPDSGELTKTKKLAHELGVKDRVIFAGTLTEHEKISAYHSASLFAIPSRREGLPLTLIEALASGLPIVGSDVDSLPYFVKNGVNGFLSGYGNYKQLAQNIILILKNKKLHDKMSRKNRVQAKNYTWQKISRELLDLYEE